jgi:hypothetical protein
MAGLRRASIGCGGKQIKPLTNQCLEKMLGIAPMWPWAQPLRHHSTNRMTRIATN